MRLCRILTQLLTSLGYFQPNGTEGPGFKWGRYQRVVIQITTTAHPTIKDKNVTVPVGGFAFWLARLREEPPHPLAQLAVDVLSSPGKLLRVIWF